MSESKRKLVSLTRDPNHPAVVAEQLLKRTLPEEAYLDICARGEFSVVINNHTYTFKRKNKTLVNMSVKDFANGLMHRASIAPNQHNIPDDIHTYSCCIDLEQPIDGYVKRPDQDRIVAEYLLVINDEKKYLEIANLTDVTPDKWYQAAGGVGFEAWAERRYQERYQGAMRYLEGTRYQAYLDHLRQPPRYTTQDLPGQRNVEPMDDL